MSYLRRPKSDLGTILLHWLIVSALCGAVLTGLAIAALDNPDLRILPYVSFLLPGENVWYLHLAFGIALVASFIAYAVYIRRTDLTDRIRFDKSRLRALLIGGRPRWASVNVILYWVLFIALGLETVAGLLLFFGWGGSILTLHLHAVWVFLAFPFLHALGHWLYGGEGQLLRIFTPQWRLPQRAPQLLEALIERVQRLEVQNASPPAVGEESAVTPARLKTAAKPATVAAPLAIATTIGVGIAFVSPLLDTQSRQALKIVKINAAEAPVIDGDISDAAWRRASAQMIVTQHGANFDGGESKVEIRALHDGTFAYFAFTWTDPTRSLKHMPLVKQEDGWRLMRSASPGNEAALHEDKFAVLLAAGGPHLIGKGIHFGRQPIPGKPEGATGRGLHYIAGGYGDVWQWRASHGGLNGRVDNGHFGPPLPASAAHSAGRYPGGFELDPSSLPYQNNFELLSDRETYPLVRPRRFPKSREALLRLQSVSLDPERSEAENSAWWLKTDETEPFSDELNERIPVGTVIPSVLLTPKEAERLTDVIGAARWASGRWSLEVKRRLDTGGSFDVAIKTGALMWVAAFDHAETWHTYHVRPLELEVE
ncbi:MAG: ethylbenzene dehydrogenase-related protein [Rhodomicrobium sp.]